MKKSESIKTGKMVKIDLDFTQFHIKMLADVMEALIGAVFLDCLYNDKKDEHYSDEGFVNPKAIDETEKIWKDLLEPYLELYADNFTLPDKAKYYNLLGEKPYTQLFRSKINVFSNQITAEDNIDLKTRKISLKELSIHREMEKRQYGSVAPTSAVDRYSFNCKL
jgi:hypothetical protein